MNRNSWIAVAAGILVIGFFLFGGDIMPLFQGTSQSVPSDMNTPSVDTLQVEDVVVGTGDIAFPGDLLTVHYVGTLDNGVKFDSSIDRGVPFQFTLGAGQVIQGWEMGFDGMKVGGKRRIVIPPSLGYGEIPNGPIPAGSTLIFEVELVAVQKQ